MRNLTPDEKARLFIVAVTAAGALMAAALFAYSPFPLVKGLAAAACIVAAFQFGAVRGVAWAALAAIAAAEYSSWPALPFSAELVPLRGGFVVVAIFASAIAFWLGRASLIETEAKEHERESALEANRAATFPRVFPRLARMPVLGAFARRFYQEGLAYGCALLLLVAVSIPVFTYHLGARDFYEDEYQVVGAAAGYYRTGEFYIWNWLADASSKNLGCAASDQSCHYERAWPHSWLIAQAYRLFGVSEWSSRIVSAVLGILFIPLLYAVARYFVGSKKVALMAASAALFYPSYITFFRYARMYALLAPLFILLVYLVHHALAGRTAVRSENAALRFLRRNFPLDYPFVAAAAALLILCASVHVNALVIVPAAYLFVIIMAAATREQTWVALAALGAAGIAVLIAAYEIGIVQSYLGLLTFFGKHNLSYLSYLTQYPFSVSAGIAFLVSGMAAVFTLPKSRRDKLLFLYVIVAFSFVFFAYVADRYSSFVYISHVTPLALLLILFSATQLARLAGGGRAVALLAILLALSAGIRFADAASGQYASNRGYGDYSAAYQVILDNYRPGTDVIFGQYLRSYYLRALAPEGVTTVNMLSNQQYPLAAFETDLARYDSGYVTWETRKTYHLQPALVRYVRQNFKQLHGTNLDDTKVEVYYFDRVMVANAAP